MASEVRNIIREIENELAQAEYQAAQWRGLSIALVLQHADEAFRAPEDGAYYVSDSTLDQIKNWDIDAEQSANDEVVITLTKADDGVSRGES